MTRARVHQRWLLGFLTAWYTHAIATAAASTAMTVDSASPRSAQITAKAPNATAPTVLMSL